MSQFPIAVGSLYPAEGSNHAVVTMAQPDKAYALKGERVVFLRESDFRNMVAGEPKRPKVQNANVGDYSFAGRDRWRSLLNYDQAAVKLGCIGTMCGDGEECTGDVIMLEHDKVVVPVPVCWHHANLMEQHDFGVKSLNDDGLANRIARRILIGAVATYCRIQPGLVTASSIAWFAVCHNVLTALPGALLKKAGMNLPEHTRRVGAGYRDTDARYQNAPHELAQQCVDEAIKQLTVDAETANALMGIPKLKTFHSEAYLKWVRSLPCAVTGKPDTEAHHLIDTLGGKMGGKTHDLFVMPLAPEQHRALHQDRAKWEKRNGPQWYHVLKTIDRALALGVVE
ncbi:DUF968 domain-containing protein [Aliidiomarina sp. Khilg15.8]